MRFYNRQHRHDCRIDLHVKMMDICILDATGQVLVHRSVPSNPEALLATIAPYRDDLVVAAEGMVTWYGLADRCAAEGIAFVLGYAWAMKAIHGGKAKNDTRDSAGGSRCSTTSAAMSSASRSATAGWSRLPTGR